MNIINLITNPLRSECGAGAPAFLSAVYNRGTQAKKRQADVPQYGRSMIEMLGVLAIVGVLSVGGIAGYSKAMQKYRVNKTIDQITQISNGIHTLYTSRNNYEGLTIFLLSKAKIIPQELIDSSEEQTASTITFDNWLSEHPEPQSVEFTEPEPSGYEEWLAWSRRRQSWEQTNNDAYNVWAYLANNSCNNGFCTTTTTTQALHGKNPFGGKVLISVEDNAKAFSLNYLGLPEDACIDLLTQDWGTTDLIAAGVDSQITSTQGCTGDKGSHVCNNMLPVTVDKAMTLCEQQNANKGVILKFK